MKVKELFRVVDTRFTCPDITIIDDSNSSLQSIKSFKYPKDGRTYVDIMLSQFGDSKIISNGVTFGTDENGINYIIVEVE